jgi:hypothetical protein
MSGLKYLQEELLSRLDDLLVRKGFKRREQDFYRNIAGGRQAFHLSFIKHSNDFDVTADVAVRHNALEDLINEGNSRLSSREKSQTYSIGAELGNISIGQPIRWTVSSESEIPQVCSGLLASFEKIGLPYLQRYSFLDEVLRAISGDDRASWLHSPIHSERAMRAIGVAYLLRKKELFHQLVATKAKYLNGKQDFGLPEFNALAERLSSSWDRGSKGDIQD